ncbi:MAG: hypothetical protein D8M58_17465 [Calditrichaeota bacterium]|nr:MAG: hypothetical protein DWQ03_01380 [Calditrichota bacterium]MBL1207196.1 hypothetical protein [Calditrichota bacterium]NOG47029.1 hypothetical protein [Calditrichota bacterium]
MKLTYPSPPLKQLNNVIRLSILLIGLSILTSCMMGIHKLGRLTGSEIAKSEQLNESGLIDQLIDNAIKDLSKSEKKSIEFIAVWDIKSQGSGLDSENVRQKIINSLVNNTSIKVVSREHLDELLSEQSLTLTGTIDSTKAVKIGSLIGVQGFITGYIAKQKDKIELSLSLIKTSSGEVVWSTIQQEKTTY